MTTAAPRLVPRPGISIGLRTGVVFHHPEDPRIEFHISRPEDDAILTDLWFAAETQSRFWGSGAHETLHPRIARGTDGLPSLAEPTLEEAVTAVREKDTVLLHRAHEWLGVKAIHRVIRTMRNQEGRHRRLYLTIDVPALTRLGWYPSRPWRTYLDGGDARIEAWIADDAALVQPMIEQVLGVGQHLTTQGFTQSGVACLGFRLDPESREIVPHPLCDFERAFESSGVIVVVSLTDAVGDREASRLLDAFRATPRRKQRLYLIDIQNLTLGLMESATPVPGELVPIPHAAPTRYPKRPSLFSRAVERLGRLRPHLRKKRRPVVLLAKRRRTWRERYKAAKPTLVSIALYALLFSLTAVLAVLVVFRW